MARLKKGKAREEGGKRKERRGGGGSLFTYSAGKRRLTRNDPKPWRTNSLFAKKAAGGGDISGG